MPACIHAEDVGHVASACRLGHVAGRTTHWARGVHARRKWRACQVLTAGARAVLESTTARVRWPACCACSCTTRALSRARAREAHTHLGFSAHAMHTTCSGSTFLRHFTVAVRRWMDCAAQRRQAGALCALMFARMRAGAGCGRRCSACTGARMQARRAITYAASLPPPLMQGAWPHQWQVAARCAYEPAHHRVVTSGGVRRRKPGSHGCYALGLHVRAHLQV